MIQSKQLTENSWVLSDHKTNKSVGMITRKNGKFTRLGKQDTFESLDALVLDIFKDQLINDTSQTPDDVEKITEVNGYPTRHPLACEFTSLEVKETQIETYKSKPNSNILYAAGWFGLKFKTGWTGSYCPKLSTLKENDFIGPFKNEFDLKFQVKKANESNK